MTNNALSRIKIWGETFWWDEWHYRSYSNDGDGPEGIIHFRFKPYQHYCPTCGKKQPDGWWGGDIWVERRDSGQ